MVDITVRGAGIMGLMCAWMAVSRGATVRGVDAGGVAAGASGGIVGALAPHVPENWNAKKAMQFRALDTAEGLWADIAKVGGADPGYGRTGRVQPIEDSAVQLAEARSTGAASLWEGRYAWRVAEAAEFGVPSPSGLVIHDTLSARIHPRQGCKALASALLAKGVEVVPNAKVDGVEVWATGAADLDAISASLDRVVGMGIKGQAALLCADLKDAPQLFVDGLHIVPHADGTVAVGSTTEREFVEPTATDAQLDPIIEKARAAWPILRDAPIVARWAGLRPRAKSRAPMVGPHPTRPGAYVANGGFKIGLAMAPIVAGMLMDMILDNADTIPPEFKPEASL